jgi:hypothetical protein
VVRKCKIEEKCRFFLKPAFVDFKRLFWRFRAVAATKLTSGEVVGQATAEAAAAIQASITVSAMVPIIAAAGRSSH